MVSSNDWFGLPKCMKNMIDQRNKSITISLVYDFQKNAAGGKEYFIAQDHFTEFETEIQPFFADTKKIIILLWCLSKLFYGC